MIRHVADIGDYAEAGGPVHPSAFTRLVVFGAVGLLAVVIILHMGALGLGEWQKDEYRLGVGLRDQGMWYMIHRFFSISPRPASEILLWAYGELVLVTHHPLIGEVLAAGWCGLLGCCCGALMFGRMQAAPFRIFRGLGVFCLFILGHPVADMFYWPQAMAAYLPTIGGLALLTVLIMDDRLRTRRGRMMAMFSLVVACGSSELGAMVVLPFTVFILLGNAFRKVDWSEAAWVIVPFVLSVNILLGGSIDRGVNPTPLLTPTAHHFVPSLIAAVPEAPRAYAMVDPNDGDWGHAGVGSMAKGIPLKLLMFVGFAMLSPVCFPRVRRFPLLALAGAMLVGIFASIASAYLEFGFLCCQRHETARQCLVVLALLAAAGLLPACRFRFSGKAGVLCLMVVMAPMAAWTLPNLVYADQHATASHAHLARLWATGFSHAGPAIMEPSDGVLVHAWTFPVGDHTSASPKSDIFEAMRFFGKRELVVLPP